MRTGVGDNPEWTAVLAASGISTGLLVRFDFQSGPIFVWTGGYSLPVNGTGDALCDGHTFEPIQQGVMVQIGANAYSYSGSDALTMALGLTDPPPDALEQAMLDVGEWQGRNCMIWRMVISTPATATAPAVAEIVRVRSGAMDELKITHDGQQHNFVLTVEAHASMISKASGSTYLDQKKFDPTDTSQDYAVAIANNPKNPSRSAAGGGDGGFRGGGGGGGGGGGRLGRMFDAL